MIAIVIVTWNSAAVLAGCLEALPAACGARAYTVAIVDNASTDGTPALVRSRWPAMALITCTHNHGYAAANNLALRRLVPDDTYATILLLNPDTIPAPAAIERLASYLERHPHVAGVAPQLVDAGGQPQPYAFGREPTPGVLLRRAVRRVLRLGPGRWQIRADHPVDWASGAALLLRRAALASVAGFDEQFFMYFEDADLCRRIRRAGWAIHVTGSARVVHLGGASARHNPAAHRAYIASLQRYYRKHYHPLAYALLTVALRHAGRVYSGEHND